MLNNLQKLTKEYLHKLQNNLSPNREPEKF